METPEQAARYWQMRHADAQIELAKATRCILDLQAEVAAVSKRHVDAAADFTKELEGIRFHLDRIGVPTHRDGQVLTLSQRIWGLLEPATEHRLRVVAEAEVERLKASLAEEKRERAQWESSFMASNAMQAECHDLIDKAALLGLERDRWGSLQDRIRILIERASNPVHVAPPPADTASCEQHLQELIEELEAELKAAREHPAIDSIHAALDRAGIARHELSVKPPCARPKTPQRRIADLEAQRDTYRILLEQVRWALRCGQLDVTADIAKRCREHADLLTWLDKVGDLVVLNLRVGPVCVKRGATGAHKTLRDALEAIYVSELESALRREAVK